MVDACVLPEMFREQYGNVFDGERRVERDRSRPSGELYAVGRRRAPTFRSRRSLVDLPPSPGRSSRSAAPACWPCCGDSVTTDHISPAGSIAKDEPGGQVPGRARRRSRSTSTATARGAATTA